MVARRYYDRDRLRFAWRSGINSDGRYAHRTLNASKEQSSLRMHEVETDASCYRKENGDGMDRTLHPMRCQRRFKPVVICLNRDLIVQTVLDGL